MHEQRKLFWARAGVVCWIVFCSMQIANAQSLNDHLSRVVAESGWGVFGLGACSGLLRALLELGDKGRPILREYGLQFRYAITGAMIGAAALFVGRSAGMSQDAIATLIIVSVLAGARAVKAWVDRVFPERPTSSAPQDSSLPQEPEP